MDKVIKVKELRAKAKEYLVDNEDAAVSLVAGALTLGVMASVAAFSYTLGKDVGHEEGLEKGFQINLPTACDYYRSDGGKEVITVETKLNGFFTFRPGDEA